MTPKEQAVKALREAKTNLLAELRQIDDALMALGALTAKDTAGDNVPGKVPTLIDKVLMVMEQEDRVWSAETMLEALSGDNFPGLNPRDPKAGIRVCFRRLAKKGLVDDAGYGKWRARKWLVEIDPSNLLGSVTDAERRAIVGDELYDANYEPSAEDLLEMEYEARAAGYGPRAGYDPAEEPF